MTDTTFSHGQPILCPECPSQLRNGRPVGPWLYVVETNYSGCSVDYGNCPDCGKGFCISYKVASIKRDYEWDTKPLEVLEAEEAQAKLEIKRKEYEKLKAKFERSA